MWKLFIARLILYLPVKIFGSCNPRPINPQEELDIKPDLPIVYVMQSDSISDLLTLEKLTRRYRLPNPFSMLIIDKDSVYRTAFMKHVRYFIPGPAKDYSYSTIFKKWQQFAKDHKTDIQIIPVTIFWSRNPGRDDEPYHDPVNRPYTALHKFFRLLFFGFDNLTVLSGPIPMNAILQHQTENEVGNTVAHACRLHFERRYHEIVGPHTLNRNHLIQELLESPGVNQAIQQRADETQRNESEITAEAYIILNNMLADMNYHTIRISGAMLHLIWNKFYQGINVKGAEAVRQLIRSGHEIVYVPCHRSHMDYMLLTYAITTEGLLQPHIVAGDNLNFFPINKFLRHSGVFFMRRKFKGDKLYTAIFREYLCTLFKKGYSTEFYIEGGRSRTGRTLPPRTGLVAMSVESQLSGNPRPITFIPTYLGYEKVMEVNSYMSELNGKEKEKESPWQLLNFYKRLKYYGRGYVSFGEPISLPTFLREHVPEWRNDIIPDAYPRPKWLFDTVKQLSDEIVMNLNASAAVNGLNLTALALHSVTNHTISIKNLEKVINFYLFILKISHVTKNASIPAVPAQALLKQAMELHPFHYEIKNEEKWAVPTAKEIIYLTYFRNNILHFFVLPALIITIIKVHKKISMPDIIIHTRNVFYFLRHELFAPVQENELDAVIREYLNSFQLAEYIKIEHKELYTITNNSETEQLLTILENSIQLNLIRFLIGAEVVSSYQENPITQEDFIKRSVKISKSLPKEITDNSPEFSEPITFKVMWETFVRHNYVNLISNQENTYNRNPIKLMKLNNAVGPLLSKSMLKDLMETCDNNKLSK